MGTLFKIMGKVAGGVAGFFVLMWLVIVGGARIADWLNAGDAAAPPAATQAAARNPVEIVTNSPWDGSVRQVERWLEDTLKDPDSFEAIEWSPVIKVPEGTPMPHKYIVRVKYRAKNSFGGYVVENTLVYLDAAGNVLSQRQAEE